MYKCISTYSCGLLFANIEPVSAFALGAAGREHSGVRGSLGEACRAEAKPRRRPHWMAPSLPCPAVLFSTHPELLHGETVLSRSWDSREMLSVWFCISRSTSEAEHLLTCCVFLCYVFCELPASSDPLLIFFLICHFNRLPLLTYLWEFSACS